MKKTNNETMKGFVIGYTRVSSEEQVTNFSISNQKDYIHKEAEKLNLEVLKIFTDEGISAKDIISRPALLEMLEFARKNQSKIVSLVVYKYDRLARDTHDFLTIDKKLAEYGIDIKSCIEPTENNPYGRFFKTLSAASAQLDNELKGLRTKDGIKKRMLSGYLQGKAPVGYLNSTTDDGRQVIIPDKELFDLVKYSWELMLTGAYSLQAITNKMNEMGIVVKLKKRRLPIRVQHAQRIFRNPSYYGKVVSKEYNINVEGKHQPMISEDQFFKVQLIIDGRRVSNNYIHVKNNPQFPLRGILRCENCSLPLTGGFSRGRRGIRYPYYFCRKHPKSFPRDRVEGLFVNYLDYITPKKELKELFLQLVRERFEQRWSVLIATREAYKARLNDLKTKLSRVEEGYLSGVYTAEQAKELKENLQSQLIVANVENNEAKFQQIDIEKLLLFMNKLLTNISKAWQAGTITQRLALAGSIFPKGLYFTNDTFRTPELGLSYKLLSGFSDRGIPLGVVNNQNLEPIITSFYKLQQLFLPSLQDHAVSMRQWT